MPPLAPGSSTSRARYRCLPSFEHSLHEAHVSSTQSCGCEPPSHEKTLQGLVDCIIAGWSPSPQRRPPCAACCLMARMRTCWPPPHSRLQPLQAIHLPSSQSTGLWRSPHGSVTVSGPWQSLPPWAAARLTLRSRDLCSVASHAAHSSQALNRQSRGVVISTGSQYMESLVSPKQGSPPHRFGVTSLLRVQRPETPSFAHALHSSHRQSTGEHWLSPSTHCGLSGHVVVWCSWPTQRSRWAQVSAPSQSWLQVTVQVSSSTAEPRVRATSNTRQPVRRPMMPQRAILSRSPLGETRQPPPYPQGRGHGSDEP
mmetsp:Transcript_88018/g.226949  ORF Transcript_88018/g.226949 Transcript_88018/m.226949 type:complete len:312 (-) Transcript_88018:7-942(-)